MSHSRAINLAAAGGAGPLAMRSGRRQQGGALPVLGGSFTKLGPALAQARARTGRAIIAHVGDSVTAGWGAANLVGTGVGVNYMTDARRVNAWPQQMAALWQAAGYPCRADALWGVHSGQAGGTAGSVSDYQTYNPNVSFGTGWTTSTVFGPGGYYIYAPPGTTGTFTFTPEVACDRLDVYHTKIVGGGKLNVSDSGGLLGNVDCSNTVQAVSKTTISRGAASTLPFLITQNVSGDCFIMGLVPYNSGAPCLEIWNMGWGGSKASDWNVAANPYDPTPCLQFITPVPHLYTVELGANEANAGVAAATFQTNLNTLVGTLKALGNDVLLAKCHPAFPTSNSYNIPAGYLTAIDAVTTGQSIHAGVNFNTLPFVTPNDYYDNIHATKSGYAREASAAFAVMSA